MLRPVYNKNMEKSKQKKKKRKKKEESLHTTLITQDKQLLRVHPGHVPMNAL